MVCRVRVRIRRDGKMVDVVALLNSGFETDAPDIAVPVEVAEELGLWPPQSSLTAVLETGGGDVVSPYYVACADLELILGDREPKRVRVNIIVNPHIDEVAISDYIASELGVILLDFKKGMWRLKDDPIDKVRMSVQR